MLDVLTLWYHSRLPPSSPSARLRPYLVPSVLHRRVIHSTGLFFLDFADHFSSAFPSVRARNMAHNVAQDLEHGPRLDKHEIARLQGVLRETINSNADCTICGDVPIDPRITVCEHVFCSSWFVAPGRFALSARALLTLRYSYSIDDYVDSRACCAVCRYSIGPEEIIEAEPVSESASVVDEGEMEVLARQAKDGASYSAAKTARLIELLKATEPGVKSLVFSQVRVGPRHQ